MNSTERFIELNYYYHDEFSTAAEVIQKHRPSNLFAPFLAKRMEVTLVKHCNFEGSHQADGVGYRFFPSKNKFFHIPSATHRFVKEQQPAMALVQGLIFPWQVMALKRKLGKDCKIVLQHQGEVPFRKKRVFQRRADRSIDGYIFTSLGNASEWLESGIIKDASKCYEIIPSSTTFSKLNKEASKLKTGMTSPINFLWVGRLNSNKDPLTVLHAFGKYFTSQPSHSLFMIYSEDDLLGVVKETINQHPLLINRVKLVGKIPHDDLEHWYSAADYFVSGSHREGGSYALTEAMACGCIPVVTAIPSALKAIGEGKAGFSYPAGNKNELSNLLLGLDHETKDIWSGVVTKHFTQHFSAPAIADKIWQLYLDLKSK